MEPVYLYEVNPSRRVRHEGRVYQQGTQLSLPVSVGKGLAERGYVSLVVEPASPQTIEMVEPPPTPLEVVEPEPMVFEPPAAEESEPTPIDDSETFAPQDPAILSEGSDNFIESDLVNLNTADLEVLTELPLVGESTAQAIIDNRPYSSVDEVPEKVGSSFLKRRWNEISPKVTV